MFHQLSLLDASRTSWRIKARVTRMWPSISSAGNGNETLKGYNLILLDDDDYHVHAFIYADTWKQHADKIEEGSIYAISSFYTKEATGSLKPVSSNILINFSPTTTVEKIEEDDFMIPRHKFEFIDIGDLFDLASSHANVEYADFSTDVIGVIEEYESLSKINTKFGERDILKFRITDGRNSAKVTVWTDLAIATDARYRSISQHPVIVILASTKINTFRSTAQITTIPSSRIYLNLDVEAVTAMKQRLEEEGYIPGSSTFSSPTTSDFSAPAVIHTVTLKELSEKTGIEFRKMNFICRVRIKNVEEADNWWYNCCNKNKCNEELIKVEGKYRCCKCNRNYPLPQKRYRVIVLAEDETEAFNFVLLDRAVKRMIGKTAPKIIAEKITDAEKNAYPLEIKKITGREVNLLIELNEENVALNSTVFVATDAYESGSTASTQNGGPSSSISSSGVGDNNAVNLAENGNTPCTSNSATKKIKKEK